MLRIPSSARDRIREPSIVRVWGCHRGSHKDVAGDGNIVCENRQCAGVGKRPL